MIRQLRDDPIKLLVATRAPQQARENDFNFTFDVEPLTLPTLVCSTPEKRESCGCGRCFSGIASSLATTYAVVSELNEAETADFSAYFRDSPHVEGWRTHGFPIERTIEIFGTN